MKNQIELISSYWASVSGGKVCDFMSIFSNDFFSGFFIGGLVMSLLLIFIFRKGIQDDMKNISELQHCINELERKNDKLIHFIKYKLHRYTDDD